MSNIKLKKAKKADPFDMLSDAPKITVAQLEKEKPSEIWAINILPNPSRLLIAVGDDGKTVLTLENTWLPQQLTTMATFDQMIGSQNFRMAVTGDLIRRKPPSIKIISAELAEQVLATAEAVNESDELASMREGVIAEQKKVQTTSSDEKPELLKPTTRIVHSVSRLNQGIYSEGSMTQMMKVHRDSLSDDDLKFIAQSASKEGIKKLAAKMLNRRSDTVGTKGKVKKLKKKVKRIA